MMRSSNGKSYENGYLSNQIGEGYLVQLTMKVKMGKKELDLIGLDSITSASNDSKMGKENLLYILNQLLEIQFQSLVALGGSISTPQLIQK